MGRLPDSVVNQTTSIVTTRSDGKSYIAVRPGLGMAIYYATPFHRMVDAIESLIASYFDFIPQDAITALCGRNNWGKFSPAGLKRQLAKLHEADVSYTNIDLSSGDQFASEGPYGFHLNGGNLANLTVHPNNTNVVYFEFPHDELQRVGCQAIIDWCIRICSIHPFESAQLGYSFNQLQRHWTDQADEFIGNLAMRFRGFDILEPALARNALGHLPNCSWLTVLGDNLLTKLGGPGPLTHLLANDIEPIHLTGGLLLRAGEFPAIGDTEGQPTELAAIRSVAQATRALRIQKPVLCYGSQEFRSGWLNRFDD